MKYGPIFLPPTLYDRAEAEGFDMSGYVKEQLIPLMPTERIFVVNLPLAKKPHYEKFRYARPR